MTDITLAIDEPVLDEVRTYAAKRNTTVDALVRDFLIRLASEETQLAATRRKLMDLMDNSTGDIGPDFVWNREALYEERMLPRHERPDLRSRRKDGGSEEV